MSIPAAANLSVYQGDTFTTTFTFQNSDGTAIPFPAGTWKSQIRLKDASEPLMDIAVDTSELAQGKIKLSLTAAQTRKDLREAKWDLQHTATSGGVVRTYLRGDVTWMRDVTV